MRQVEVGFEGECGEIVGGRVRSHPPDLVGGGAVHPVQSATARPSGRSGSLSLSSGAPAKRSLPLASVTRRRGGEAGSW